MDKEVLDLIRQKGLLLEKEIYDLINNLQSSSNAKQLLENLERISGQKMITKKVLSNHFEFVSKFVKLMPGEDQEIVERTFVNLGVHLEIRKESNIVRTNNEAPRQGQNYKIFYADTKPEKKLEVKDFVGHFRSRFQQLQRILMLRPELQKNLVSINKISSERTSLSIIGILKEKRVTKNKNLMLEFEDLTGEIKVLIRADNAELLEKADELQLDDIVGIKASGNRDFLFAHDIFFPESILMQKTKFDNDTHIAFISDTHCGSNRHLSKSLNKFINWISSDDPTAKKIEYLFIVGDTVDGVGIFPNQEEVLKLKSMKEQYEQLAGYLKRIPKRITIFMCPGQHDAVRVAEPQPIIGKKYAPQLYEIENLVLVTNPTMVKLIEGEKEFKVLMYHGASIHTFINEIKYLRLMKAHKTPAKAVEQMLKRRHLAPTHGSATGIYIPNLDNDPLVINEVPDVLCTGEVHRLDISNYNGVLILTGSCWQAQTPFEEKVGNEPDPGKVPVLNLKTRELKIYDFRDETEVDERGAYITEGVTQ